MHCERSNYTMERINTTHIITDKMLPPVLKEYDSFTNSLQNQIEFYKQEHTRLRSDVTALLEENQQLANQLKAALGSNLGQEPPGEPRRRAVDMVANLQRQLLLTSQEKAAAMELYHSAVKELEALEEELNAYRDNRHLDAAQRQFEEMKKEYSTAIGMLEEKISSLEGDLVRERTRVEELEDELCRVRTERDRLTSSLREREQQLEEALHGQTGAMGRLESVGERIRELEDASTVLRRERDELESALANATQRAEELARREWAALARLEEALTLVDAAMLEKDAALTAEARATEEVSRLQRSVEQLLEEAGKRVAEEATRLKQQFNQQLDLLVRDMRELQDELARKQAQLEKAGADLQRLEDELERLRQERNALPDYRQLQHSVDMAYRDLQRSEQQSSSVAGERDQLQKQLEQAQDTHRAELNQALEELRKLRMELQMVRAKADQAEAMAQGRAALLEEQVSQLEQQLTALQAASYIVPLPEDPAHSQCEAQLEEYRRMLTQLNDMQQHGARLAQGLQMHLDAQMEAKNRWQDEVRNLSNRFERRIDSLRGQLGGLRRANRNLERELAQTRSNSGCQGVNPACPAAGTAAPSVQCLGPAPGTQPPYTW